MRITSLLLTLLIASPALASSPVERLAGSLRFETVSHQDPAQFNAEPFVALRRYLEQSFPLSHAQLEVESVAEYSLLFTWRGSDPELPPLLLTSHFDVVPVQPGTLKDWEHPPFAGVVADGYVWGRGALDDKVGVLGTLEAVEGLLSEGFAPRRTVYLAFGHDEELGGDAGAKGITDLLEARGVQLWMSLDEGMAITEGLFPGIDLPIAMIGVAEKGFLTLELTARAPGGHSSIPSAHSAIGDLARAIARLEAQPLPAGESGVARETFLALAPHLSFPTNVVAGNPGLFGWLIDRTLSNTGAGNAMMRTTTAVTMIDGGVKANVLPTSATATVNFRLAPGDTAEGVTEQVRAIVDDPAIEIVGVEGSEASEISSSDSEGWKALAGAISETFPAVVVAPALVVGGTDSKHYGRIAQDAYRFTPFRMGPEDTSRFHGLNERVAVDNYAEIVAFYGVLVRRAAGP